MKIKAKRIFVVAAILVVGFLGIRAVAPGDNFFEVSKNLEIFATLYKELNIYYVDETQPGDLMKTGIDAMLLSLDPYTNYITESNIEDYRFMTTGQYGGIGSLIRSVDGDVYISEPYEDSPAQKSGLRAGDKIIKIDGITISDKDQDEISSLLKGQSGTDLKVTYERFGTVSVVAITREEIKIPDVPYYGMLDDKVGYISLNSFTQTASKEVREAFVELRDDRGMEKLIFDLRGNGGGLLREAINIVNFFVPKGQEVVRTKGKISEWDRTHIAINEPLDLEMPLVILVDQGSASASEIVSGSIQDLDRGVVIGNTTFGKGLVQQTKDLQYNSKLKLTVAKYYIPSGRCIQKLDYSNKTEGGDVEEVPDSLLKKFATKSGRAVMDGRGIEPDVKVENREIPHVVISLLTENLFFKYASDYANDRDTIADAARFKLSDEDYSKFVKYLDGKNYSYTTDTEKEFEKLVTVAKDEKYYEITEEAFKQMEVAISSKKNNDLEIFREDIETILENEIVSRYYYQKGRIENSLAEDPAIDSAMTILANTEKYSQILKPQ
ncbi:MAG: carboxyl-terminal processing protease [Flammeovirgaceae bacterium]|jgi:carboxyl-terminal processing protease